jgi:hypothetical protein
MSLTPLFGQLPRRRDTLELLGEKLANPIFRIIKWTPWPGASNETRMATALNEFGVQITVLPGGVPYLVQNFWREHWVVDGAQ